jgi:hypothetical protein
MKAAILFLTLLTPSLAPLEAAQPAIGWDGSRARFFGDTDGPFTIGFQFRAESDIALTALGAFDYLGDGFSTPRRVGVWSLAGGEPIVTATIHFEPLSPTTFGANFQFVAVPEPAVGLLLGCGLALLAGWMATKPTLRCLSQPTAGDPESARTRLLPRVTNPHPFRTASPQPLRARFCRSHTDTRLRDACETSA